MLPKDPWKILHMQRYKRRLHDRSTHQGPIITTFSLQYSYAIQYKIDAALKETPNTSSIHGGLEMIT